MLTRLVRKALGSRPARAFLAAAGVAASTLMVLVLVAASRSLATGVKAYAGQAGADVWIAPKGTDNLIRSGGTLPADMEGRLTAIPGVAAADPLLRTFAALSAEEGAKRSHRLTLMELGYRIPSGIGGPPRLRHGDPPAGDGDIVLDQAAAFRLGLKVGDFACLNGRPLRVVGLSRGTNLLSTQFLFRSIQAAGRASGMTDRVSFFVVKLKDSAGLNATASAIQARFPDTSVMTGPDFVANNLREVSAGVRPLLLVLTGVGLAVAALMVGLLAHGLAEEKRAEMAVLLALGAAPRTLAAGVAVHVGALALGGTLAGALLAFAFGALLDRVLPTVELTFLAREVALVTGLFTAAGLLAVLIPLASLRRLDPMEAFRP